MAIARSSITIIRCWRWCWDILRPLDRIVLPLLAFHIILDRDLSRCNYILEIVDLVMAVR